MKVVLSVAVLASLAAPAYSLSYLESLNTAPATLAPPSGGLSGASAGAGASYLDALASPVSAAPSGSGISSYLDALPKNDAPAAGAGGVGMTSYMDALNGAAPAAPSMPSTPVDSAPAYSLDATAPVAPVTPSYVPETPSAPIVAGGNYLEAISASTSAGAPTGAGMSTYLDALPRAAATIAGAGIPSYTDALPTTNTVIGTGYGMASYTDNLTGGVASYAAPSSPAFAAGSNNASPAFVANGDQTITFTMSAADLSALLSQMGSNGGNIRLSGAIAGMN